MLKVFYMINNKKLLAIIPARGGSKRLPRKNILDLAGKPLIAWTIEAALISKYIDHVIVSTDDDEIATVSKKYGADVPFMRPTNLATDDSTSVDVVLHAIERLEQYDYIILLQPTSPLRTTKNIDESIELLKFSRSDAVISVSKLEHNPLCINTVQNDGDLSNFLDTTILNKPEKDLKQYYQLNGAIYLCDIKRLEKEKSFFLKDNCIAYKMKQVESVDIDNEIDFKLSELYLS